MANSRKRPRADLAARLVGFLQQHFTHGRYLLLGLSGGLDSRVLLHLLVAARQQLDFRLSAIHVNHRISPNAGTWADFCANLCAGDGIPFSAIEVDVPRDSGLGLEAAAREARYRALLAQNADAVVLAHHRDDQAETLLLQLLRGAGVKGLAAMGVKSDQQSAISDQGRKSILRPLLDVSRAELLEYAQSHALEWIEDESNLDLAFDRNFLRQHVLPELEQRFPNCRAALARSAAHLAEAAGLLEQIACADAEQGVHEGRLDLAFLKSLSFERAVNLLRWWIAAETGLGTSTARLHNIRNQLCTAQANAQVECTLGEATLRRYRETAYIEHKGKTQPYRIEWHGEDSVGLPDGGRLELRKVIGKGIALARLEQTLVIGSRIGGERLRTDCGRPTRSLKNLWQEAGVPPWERGRMPFIWHGAALVAVAGLGVACEWQAQAGEPGLVVEWLRTPLKQRF